MIVEESPRKITPDITRTRFIRQEFDLENIKVRFAIWHNLPVGGPVNTIEAAFKFWCYNTKKPTADNFVIYIRAKGVYWAYTEKQYRQEVRKATKKGIKPLGRE